MGGCDESEAVFGHDELEVGMVLTQLGNEAFGGVAFTIIFGRAVLFDGRFWHQGNQRTAGPDGPAPHPTFAVIRDRPLRWTRRETGGAVNRLGGKIPVPSRANK